MLTLKADKRDKLGGKTTRLRQAGILPAVLYGEGVENTPLEIDEKEFERVFSQAGETSLINLELAGKKYEVLIHEISRDPVSNEFLHVDFFCPSTKKEIEAEVPLVFEGEAPAEKDLGGNLLKEIQNVEVRGLVKNLPKEIKVNVSSLKTFEDRILIKDLILPAGIRVLKDQEEIVALVVPPRKEEIIEEKPEETPAEEKPDEEKTEEESAAGNEVKKEK